VTTRPLFIPGKDPVPIAGWAPDLDECGKSRPNRDSIPGTSSPEPFSFQKQKKKGNWLLKEDNEEKEGLK